MADPAFIVEAQPVGLGEAPPLVVGASQLVLRTPDGTPFAVAYVTGDRWVTVVKAGDPDWERACRDLGLRPSECRTLRSPAPHGAELLYKPEGY